MRLALIVFLFATQVHASTQPPAEVKQYLSRHLKGFRLVDDADIRADVKDQFSGSTIRADLDKDGKDDYAVLVMSPKEKRVSLYALVAQKKGFKHHRLSSTRWRGEPDGGPVCRGMKLKKPGEKGLADLTNFAPEGLTREQYTAVVAIEGNLPNYGKNGACGSDAEVDTYCSAGFFFERSVPRMITVCD